MFMGVDRWKYNSLGRRRGAATVNCAARRMFTAALPLFVAVVAVLLLDSVAVKADSHTAAEAASSPMPCEDFAVSNMPEAKDGRSGSEQQIKAQLLDDVRWRVFFAHCYLLRKNYHETIDLYVHTRGEMQNGDGSGQLVLYPSGYADYLSRFHYYAAVAYEKLGHYRLALIAMDESSQTNYNKLSDEFTQAYARIKLALENQERANAIAEQRRQEAAAARVDSARRAALEGQLRRQQAALDAEQRRQEAAAREQAAAQPLQAQSSASGGANDAEVASSDGYTDVFDKADTYCKAFVVGMMAVGQVHSNRELREYTRQHLNGFNYVESGTRVRILGSTTTTCLKNVIPFTRVIIRDGRSALNGHVGYVVSDAILGLH